MRTILVVEDEPRLRHVVTRLIEADGFAVTPVGTGTEAVRRALADEIDLVVLDLNLPDLSGHEVLRVVRAAKPTLPVLVLSSVSAGTTRVELLENGAVDYVTKPFVPSELLARIRLRIGPEAGPAPPPTAVEVSADAHLDLERRELWSRGARVALSQREFGLLVHLLRRRGEVCSREELLADVWGIGFDPGTNVVDVYVRRLRRKLTENAIETVRHAGYRLAAG